MTSWQLAIDTGSGYGSYYDISNPTNSLNQNYVSTRAKYDLYDGSQGRTIPSTKTTLGEVDLEFNYIDEDNNLIKDDSPKLALQSIIEAGYKVRFKTHLQSGATYKVLEGYLVDVSKPWTVSLRPSSGSYKQFFDITCTIDVIQELWV